ncbi:hypothetical protein E3N88_23035 [Mikania micrantha]|uniref:CCHC-type domain-containing protein n=1 Tax=Mikania micrantha TaxID=192012 RepID=A0A5N6NCD3_9ASTR|nr:hypothetical protein E3N88_23035 [Mikania micrantha]
MPLKFRTHHSLPETSPQCTSRSNPFANTTPLLTLDGIPADDLEEMDINYQMAMISYRAKKFYQRTGRQLKKHNRKYGFGLDKSKLKCYKCQQLGHSLENSSLQVLSHQP